MYRLAKRQRTKERDRQDFPLRQDAIQILEERRHELDIRPTAREMIQTASERRTSSPVPRVPSGKKISESVWPSASARLSITGCPAASVCPGSLRAPPPPATSTPRNTRKARYAPEAFFPVVLCRDRPRNSATAGGEHP